MARICVLTTVHPLNDVRIFYKECKSLKSAGHEVFLIISHDKDEYIDGINILHLPQSGNRLKRMVYNTLLALIKAIKVKAEVYHFHDPELIPVGMILKILRKKVIYDVHENVPKDILDKTWLGSKSIRRIISIIVNLIEITGACFFNLIIVTDNKTKMRFKSSKTVLIDNYPIINLIDSSSRINIQKIKPVIIYLGRLSKIRGIIEIIKAMEILKGKADLWFLGKWENDEFEKECKELKGWENAKYLGFLKPEDIYGYLKNADIGIVNCYPVENFINSLPTKTFEYMTCFIPVVMSDFILWQDIFKDCALFADPRNSDDIARQISILLNDEELRTRLGRKGRELIEEKYSWEAESKRFIEHYKKLIK